MLLELYLYLSTGHSKVQSDVLCVADPVHGNWPIGVDQVGDWSTGTVTKIDGKSELVKWEEQQIEVAHTQDFELLTQQRFCSLLHYMPQAFPGLYLVVIHELQLIVVTKQITVSTYYFPIPPLVLMGSSHASIFLFFCLQCGKSTPSWAEIRLEISHYMYYTFPPFWSEYCQYSMYVTHNSRNWVFYIKFW